MLSGTEWPRAAQWTGDHHQKHPADQNGGSATGALTFQQQRRHAQDRQAPSSAIIAASPGNAIDLAGVSRQRRRRFSSGSSALVVPPGQRLQPAAQRRAELAGNVARRRRRRRHRYLRCRRTVDQSPMTPASPAPAAFRARCSRREQLRPCSPLPSRSTSTSAGAGPQVTRSPARAAAKPPTTSSTYSTILSALGSGSRISKGASSSRRHTAERCRQTRPSW